MLPNCSPALSVPQPLSVVSPVLRSVNVCGSLDFMIFLLHFLTVSNPAVVGNVTEVEETKDRFHPWTVYLTASDVDACPVEKGDCQKHSHIDSVYVFKTLFAMSSMNWEFVNF